MYFFSTNMGVFGSRLQLPCQSLACQLFGGGIIGPGFAKILAVVCEAIKKRCIGSQKIGSKPSKSRTSWHDQFFGGGTARP
jgi:hypothetical protein